MALPQVYPHGYSDLPAYQPGYRCPKCGSKAKTYYCMRPHARDDPRTFLEGVDEQGHLDRRCTKCGWVWLEHTLDVAGAQVPIALAGRGVRQRVLPAEAMPSEYPAASEEEGQPFGRTQSARSTPAPHPGTSLSPPSSRAHSSRPYREGPSGEIRASSESEYPPAYRDSPEMREASGGGTPG